MNLGIATEDYKVQYSLVEDELIHYTVIRSVIEIVLFGIFGVIMGMLTDFIFPNFQHSESTIHSTMMLFAQLIFSGLVVYLTAKFYNKILKKDPDLYAGFTVFVLVYFLFQTQLYVRVSLLYYRVTGYQLERYVDFAKEDAEVLKEMHLSRLT
jgi:Na+-driven multidrug efflux pump